MDGNDYLQLANKYWQDKNFKKALVYFKESAKKGNYIAMYSIACMYFFADGVKQNYHLAYKWYLKAANNNDPEATYRVGLMLENGLGVKQDIDASFQYYLKSAEMGSLSGMYYLGRCYLAAKGVEKDLSKGLFWLNKAANLGNGIAADFLGHFYLNDQIKKALKYFRMAIDQTYLPSILTVLELVEKQIITLDVEEIKKLRTLAEKLKDETFSN